MEGHRRRRVSAPPTSSSTSPRTPRCTCSSRAGARAREHDDDLQRPRVLPADRRRRSSSARAARSTATSTASRPRREAPTSRTPRARTPPEDRGRGARLLLRSLLPAALLVFRFSNVYGRYDNDLARMIRVIRSSPTGSCAASRSPCSAATTSARLHLRRRLCRGHRPRDHRLAEGTYATSDQPRVRRGQHARPRRRADRRGDRQGARRHARAAAARRGDALRGRHRPRPRPARLEPRAARRGHRAQRRLVRRVATGPSRGRRGRSSSKARSSSFKA